MSSDRPIVVRLRPGSDGDATHSPPAGNHTRVDPPVLYLEKIGQQWMQNRGEARPGVKYVLESLPNGYTMWQRPRPGNSKHLDKYLFGHPNHKPFDSPNRFYPHFEYLMDNAGDSMGCPCTVCAGSAGVLPKSMPNSVLPKSTPNSVPMRGSSSSSSRPPTPMGPPTILPAIHMKGRPKTISVGLDTSHIDEEGTPDVYRSLIDQLRRRNTVDEIIEEPLSMDWRAEQEMLPGILHDLREKDQWIPRVGDIVLYIRELPAGVDLIRDSVTGKLQLYDEQSETFLGLPPWEAGLVGEVPKHASMHDLTEDDRKTNVVVSGLRVEPLPNVNNIDKSLSKRHKYVSLRHTRPMVLWKELLHQTQENWHPTVVNALGLTSTLSLMGKHRFRGTWPNANIYCHGLYLGFEMLAVGDTVRLLPNTNSGQTECSDILIIKSIRLKWKNLDKASNNDYDEGRPYNSEIWVYGTAYTEDPTRSDKQWVSDRDIEPPKAAHGYLTWYPLHPPSKELAIPYSRVLGRLYERDALAIWLNTETTDEPSLDTGREAVLEARAFSRIHDQRIAKELNATWYWGDSRADALNLHTINGLEVSTYDRERDVRKWRKDIKLIEGMNNHKGLPSMRQDAVNAVAAGRGLRNFMAPGTSSSLPVRTHASRETSFSSSSSTIGTSSKGDSLGSGKKRPHTVVNLTDDEDDEEIRQHTKVVRDAPGTAKRKAKVMVVID
ncbi:Nn.00g071460.m01.CDS01 [Neocucurbitaria sp. VM-36]